MREGPPPGGPSPPIPPGGFNGRTLRGHRRVLAVVGNRFRFGVQLPLISRRRVPARRRDITTLRGLDFLATGPNRWHGARDARSMGSDRGARSSRNGGGGRSARQCGLDGPLSAPTHGLDPGGRERLGVCGGRAGARTGSHQRPRGVREDGGCGAPRRVRRPLRGTRHAALRDLRDHGRRLQGEQRATTLTDVEGVRPAATALTSSRRSLSLAVRPRHRAVVEGAVERLLVDAGLACNLA
jgi:hypothetical protein